MTLDETIKLGEYTRRYLSSERQIQFDIIYKHEHQIAEGQNNQVQQCCFTQKNKYSQNKRETYGRIVTLEQIVG